MADPRPTLHIRPRGGHHESGGSPPYVFGLSYDMILLFFP